VTPSVVVIGPASPPPGVHTLVVRTTHTVTPACSFGEPSLLSQCRASGERLLLLLREALDRECAKTGKVAVLGQKSPHAGLATKRDDLRVEYKVARGHCLFDCLEQELRKSRARVEQGKAGGRQDPRSCVTGFARREGRMEEPRMRDDAQEFAQDEHRQRPAAASFRQSNEPLGCQCMLRQLLAVGVDQDVRVDRDQERPSMWS
jgi:hypothetical protein